jgi:CRISPR-associated protein Cas2
VRHVYIVTYDISDPRRLRRVYRTMRGFGRHLQLSVFQCDLTPTARIQMIAALDAEIERDQDQVLIIDLGATDARPIKQIEALGRPMPLHERRAVVI